MSIFNQYSYPIITLLLLVSSYLILRRYAVSRRLIGLTMAGLAILSLSGLFILRPGSSDVSSMNAAQAALRNGKPTLLEFFSNYCAGCLALRPAVDLLVSELGDEYNVLRIDIHTELGRELRQSVAFSYTPEFVLFDRSGQEVWRAHTLPSREQIYALAPQLANLTP